MSGVATVNHGNIRKIISVADPAPAQLTPEQTHHRLVTRKIIMLKL